MPASRLSRIFATLAGAGLISGVALLTALWWEGMQWVYPSAANESAFMKSFSPDAVVRPFQASGYCSSSGGGSGASTGKKSVEHTAEYRGYFTMHRADEPRLMNELRAGVERQLMAGRAQISSENGDAVDGFRFAYRDGPTVGSVVVSPLQPAAIGHATPLPEGLVDITVSVSAKETWYVQGGKGGMLISSR